MTMRVMWLLNHSSARKFEIPMLKSIGIQEIFLPKIYPNDQSFRSASVDWSEDKNLSIPKADLDLLNAVDWYGGGSKQAWEVANKYFDVCFFILVDASFMRIAGTHFDGALLWRTYGLDKSKSYGKVLDILSRGLGSVFLNRIGNRLFFAKAYNHIDNVEPSILASRSVYLPLGLHNSSTNDQWQGNDKRIFFICPDIGFNHYYQDIYNQFVENFSELPYAIGGAQPVHVTDPAVLGFTPQAVHEENMRQMRLMFYHSNEPNHVHYHPFEAIRVGMPLVFMAEGLLDRIGGAGLPGRCESIREARHKIERILDDDWDLINSIRQSQTVLLEPMKAENCEQAWRDGFKHILSELAISRTEQEVRRSTPKRVAVIVPIGYRGGSLRGAKLLAQAIYQGSRQFNEAAEVVFFHLDDDDTYPISELKDIFPGIKCRAFNWKRLMPDEARRAMYYAGYENWEPNAGQYLVVDDGIRQLQDCDLWLVISDRLSSPLLPLRPTVHMIYDYLQRYEQIMPQGADQPFLNAAWCADRVLVTTDFTRQDALQYAGLDSCKVIKVPMLAPDLSSYSRDYSSSVPNYFIWSTNSAPHKNHYNALEALRLYYKEFNGCLDCHVTGVDTADFLKSPLHHLTKAISLVKGSKVLRRRVRWLGELPDKAYHETLSGAAFLWHAGKIDNGTFSVIEAAGLGVPALSSDYPAMREIDQVFGLNLAWMDAADPRAMAERLRQMESDFRERRKLLPTQAQLGERNVEKLAGEYWKAVRECL